MLLQADAVGASALDQRAARGWFDQDCGRLESRSAMRTLSLSEAKMKLSALVDSVRDTDQEVVITKNGVPAAVLVSPDEFESWRETIAVRFDPGLMGEIRAGLAELREGKAKLYTLEELFEGE